MDSSIYELKKEFAIFMVKSGVLTFGDFITKSGRKTPYFINTGNYKTGAQIARLGSFYAGCIKDQINEEITALFGPAYKGIPLVVATAIALSNDYDQDVRYCFNRKEAKDHGEGGTIIGYQLKDRDKVLIVEDVITAGTAVREILPVIRAEADVDFVGMVISVDRMERGQNTLTATQELFEAYGIRTYAIITIREILEILHNIRIDGKIVLDDHMKTKIEDYLAKYCAL